MPCHAARARQLIRNGRAVRRFDRGLFYIKLLDRADGETQDIAVGVDPGSKKEGITVKSTAHTFLNIQADAVTWVKKHEEVSTMMRRNRRGRKTPYRQMRKNRNRNKLSLPPSTRARWSWKLRLLKWLCRYYPVSTFVVEDVAAVTKQGKRKWNVNFSPLEVGKNWFYTELSILGAVETKRGYETAQLREAAGLKKLGNKMSSSFYAHCVDSWTLANWWTGGHIEPENIAVMHITPLQFHRRQLHVLQPASGGIRKRQGGTMSMGIKRGSWVKHPKYGLCYVGGTSDDKVSLHTMDTGKRVTRCAHVDDLQFLTRASWRCLS